MKSKPYSVVEEVANSVTHGVGALLSVAGLTLLVTYASLQQDVYRIVSFSIYGTTLILLYLSSTLYHSFQHVKTKQVFKLLDHCAIYLLIAGTYTPFLLVSIQGTFGWALFAIIWTLAVLGVVFKIVYRHRFEKLSLTTYLLMSWLVVIASAEMISKVPLGGLVLLATGGVIYTLGVIFYVGHKIPYNHAIWHGFVLGGSACHFFAIFLYVLPEINVISGV